MMIEQMIEQRTKIRTWILMGKRTKMTIWIKQHIAGAVDKKLTLAQLGHCPALHLSLNRRWGLQICSWTTLITDRLSHIQHIQPPWWTKVLKNVPMRSYRRLEILSLFFGCNKLLISSTERQVWYSEQIIFSRLRICQRKHFPCHRQSQPPTCFLFSWKHFRKHISEAILWTHLPWNPAVEADKSLLGVCRHLHMGRFFHLSISCLRISQIVNSQSWQATTPSLLPFKAGHLYFSVSVNFTSMNLDITLQQKEFVKNVLLFCTMWTIFGWT